MITPNRDAYNAKESVPLVMVVVKILRLRDLPVRPR
jgi:hypothetical protein